MLDESAYLETVRTESGVVVAVAYDDDASNDCPLDWIAGHVAVSLGGVYFADWSDSEAVREECEEYAADTRPPATIEATVTVTTTGTLATKEVNHAKA